MALVEQYTPDPTLDPRIYEEFLRLYDKINRVASQLDDLLPDGPGGSIRLTSVPQPYTPVCQGSSGQVITAYSTLATYTTIGKLIFYSGVVVVTTAGAANGTILDVQLPVPASGQAIGAGREDALTGSLLQCVIRDAANPLLIWTYNNGSPIQTGAVIRFSVLYPIA